MGGVTGGRLRGLAVLLALVWAGGCAHAASGLRPQMASLDTASLPPASSTAPARTVEAESGDAGRAGDIVTAEAWDQELRERLLASRRAPSPRHHRRVAARYRELGIADAAYDQLSAAIALDRRDGAAFDARARLWRDWGFPELALGDAYRATYHASRSASAQNTLGTVLQALGRRQHAAVAYRRALVLDPGAAYALSNLCYLTMLDDSGAAIPVCESAVRLAPGWTTARNNLGLAYALSGRLEHAGREFGATGDRATGHYNMGIAYLATTRFEDAAHAFEAASALRPGRSGDRARAKQARRLAQQHQAQKSERRLSDAHH